MYFRSVWLTFRKLATFVLVAVVCALSLPASAGRTAWPNAAFAPETAAPTQKQALAVKTAGGIVEVVEYYNAGLGHYFITANPGETAFLDGGAFGGAWKRTGGTFPVWDILGAPAGTVPVCRFFGTDRYRADGTRIGPNSHFYTADPGECTFVRTGWPSVAVDGVSYPAWTFEANAFAVKLPVGGACPAGTQPLYRIYNEGQGGDPNHRYSTRADMLQAMTGWRFEGLAMCVPQGQGVTLPPQLAACGSGDCPVSTPLGSGIGLVNVVVTIANTTATPLDLIIPAGQIFVATPNTYQDGLAVERLQATIAPGTSGTFLLRLFCMQGSRDVSATGASYAPGPLTGNAQLLEIISLAVGKLGSANDPAGLKAGVIQFAIWEITDGPGTLTAQQRNLLVTILATSDNLVLVDLYNQFLATL